MVLGLLRRVLKINKIGVATNLINVIIIFVRRNMKKQIEWTALRIKKNTLKKLKLMAVKNNLTMHRAVEVLVDSANNLLPDNKK